MHPNKKRAVRLSIWYKLTFEFSTSREATCLCSCLRTSH
jgi:hypothetical protein